MNRNNLKVIVGGVAITPIGTNNEFIGAFVTDSRLMGVLVIYIHWRIVRSGRGGHAPDNFHQFFYIETTEVGIESYRSFAGDDAITMLEAEQAMIGGLGAKKVDISKREAFLLIQQYAKLNEKYGEELPEGLDEYDFILKEDLRATPDETQTLLQKTCETLDNRNQVINYFLMRLFADDLDVVNLLAKCPFTADHAPVRYAATLCRNR
ncbi:MAG: hypothetical protein LBO81_06020, partial [Clostridiales Family XIII bacterium]|nr:hypothetical protein [Clostridiales Family XIII bacterium]